MSEKQIESSNSEVDSISFCRPIPEKEFVEAYVKAYYLTEPDMERWIREHKVIYISNAFLIF